MADGSMRYAWCWGGSLVDRLILGEAARLTLLYALGLQAVLLLPLAIPLLREGAPLLAVLRLAPLQAAFLGPIVLPLALVAAIVAALTRIREDGELTALRAAGCAPLRLAAGLTPLVLVALLLSGALTFTIMPASVQHLRQGQAELVGQALATKVARQEPFIQERRYPTVAPTEGRPDPREATTVTGLAAAGRRLEGVFALRIDSSGQRWMAYAPVGLWSRDVRSSTAPLTLELGEVRLLGTTGTPARSTALVVPMPSSSAANRAEILAAAQADMRKQETDGHERRRLPWPITSALLPRWSVRLAMGGEVTDALEAQGLRELLGTVDDKRRAIAASQALIADLESRQLAELTVVAQEAPAGSSTAAWVQRRLGELAVLKQGSGGHLVNLRRDHLRALLALHQRFALPGSILFVALLAVGLGLAVPVRSRLAAVLLGLIGACLAIFPGMAVVKGVGGHLGVHPAILVWGPLLLLGGLGFALLRRATR